MPQCFPHGAFLALKEEARNSDVDLIFRERAGRGGGRDRKWRGFWLVARGPDQDAVRGSIRMAILSAETQHIDCRVPRAFLAEHGGLLRGPPDDEEAPVEAAEEGEQREGEPQEGEGAAPSGGVAPASPCLVGSLGSFLHTPVLSGSGATCLMESFGVILSRQRLPPYSRNRINLRGDTALPIQLGLPSSLQ